LSGLYADVTLLQAIKGQSSTAKSVWVLRRRIVISKKIVLALSLCVAGSLIPLQAATCASSGTLDAYVGTTCDIGALTFDFISWVPSGTNPQQPPSILASDINFSVLLNSNGTGFLLTPNVTWGTTNGFTDGELKFVVTGTGINSLYLETDGHSIANGFVHTQDAYCLGGIQPGQSVCPGNLDTGGPSQLDATVQSGNVCAGTVAGSGTTGVASVPPAAGAFGCGVTQNFAAVSSISVTKDIRADGTDGGANVEAYIDGVVNQFGPAVVPEPGTYALSVIGLGLLFLGRRQLSRS
jgi:hypothetical protein